MFDLDESMVNDTIEILNATKLNSINKQQSMPIGNT